MAKLNYKNGVTSVILRVKLMDSASTTGAGKTGLTSSSTGLIISTIADNEASATVYTAAGSTTETITTLGTFAAPTATKCRFKLVDDTNHPGIYEVQIADARWAVSNARSVIVTIQVTGASPVDSEIQLQPVPADLMQILGTLLTETAGLLAGGFKKFFNVSSPTGTLNSLPGAVAGASSGLTICGSNAATTFATLTSTGAFTINGVSMVSQTGDAYARLGAPAGVSISADLAAIKTDTGNLVTRLTAARAGYLDNLNVSGAVASQADINALNQSASRRLIITTVGQYERPDSGNATYTVEVRTYDGDGAAVNADTTPTLTATGPVSGSLSSHLSAATNPATGLYRFTYTVASTATLEQVGFDVSAVIAAATFTLACYTQVCDLVAATWTTADRTALQAVQTQTDKLLFDGSNFVKSVEQAKTGFALTSAYDPAKTAAQAGDAMTLTSGERNTLAAAIWNALTSGMITVGSIGKRIVDYLTGDAFARLGAPVGVSTSADIAAIKSDTGNIKIVTDQLATGYTVNGSGVMVFKTATLANAPSGGGGGGGVAGSGADSCTVNIKVAGANIADADVWITSDAAGTAVVAGTLQTNSAGNATFLLDAGVTYYLWMQKDGVNAIQGQSFTAVAD